MPFSYYRSVTVDHTLVAAAQTDFPLLFSVTHNDLRTVGNGGHVQHSSGHDICFFSDSALSTSLFWEMERYNATTGEVIAWVRVPSLSDSVDTVIYLAYGDASISTFQSTASSVWDTNYKGVWHFPDGSSLGLNDSTSNANNGSGVNSPAAGTGRIDGALDLGSPNTNKRVAITHASSLNVGDVFTVEAWVYVPSLTSRHAIYSIRAANPSGSWQVEVSSGGGVLGNNSTNTLTVAGPSTWIAVGSNNAVPTSSWTHVCAVKNGGIPALYVNGSLLTNQMSAAFTAQNNSDQKRIGSGTADAQYFAGLLDEVRLSATARSAAWVLDTYTSQTDAGFLTLGSELPVQVGHPLCMRMGTVPFLGGSRARAF